MISARWLLRAASLAAAWSLLASAAIPAGSSGPAERLGESIAARPGSVVRWAGKGIESCGRENRSWQPLDGSCWFPIDLLQPEGGLRVFRYRDGLRETATIEVSEYPYPVQRITIEDTSRVDLSPEILARVQKEQTWVKPLWSLEGPAIFALPLADPLDEMGKSGSFGSRRFFNDQPRSPHSGADYPAVEGTPVYSVSAGRVVLAADLFFSGNSVFVDHGDGLISMYFHLSSILVEEGQELETRAQIGRVGATGRTTGPHLHFGLRWKGARVDPSLLLGPSSAIPEISG
ncbi:MAG: M23 family metallopeptidase [Thermoanaerobaculia bacterium]